jgi:2'-5' RNA ligase
LLATAAGVSAEAFTLNLDRLDFWAHNHLLWAGCSSPPTQLAELVSTLRQALNVAGFKTGRAGGEFSPHVSLVRRVLEGAVSSADCPLSIGEQNWPCSHFVLVRSSLMATGSDYRIIGEFPLVGESRG